jgi:hypothetical protein
MDRIFGILFIFTFAMGGNNENVWWNAYYRGFYSYGLSPFYQRSMTGHIGKEFEQLGRGIARQTMTLGPFIAVGAFIVYYGKKTYKELHRKAPMNIDDSLSIKELTHPIN